MRRQEAQKSMQKLWDMGRCADAYHITSPLRRGAGAGLSWTQMPSRMRGRQKRDHVHQCAYGGQRITTIFSRTVPLSYCLGIMQRTLRSILQSP